jgi:8-oxo-dGTP pyrophosphatase MutT (NUDIX family)
MLEFTNNLKIALSHGLPGIDVQWMMASSGKRSGNFPRTPGPDAREAAVLILLFPHNDKVQTVLMQRPDYDGVHGGQISFPGGKREPKDGDIIHTAIREAREETGVNPAEINVIGTLTPLFIPVSNMIVTAVIGWSDHKPLFNYDKNEVVFLIEAGLEDLLEPSVIKMKPMEIRGEVMEIKYFALEGNVIWGATAMILNELLEIIRRDNVPVKLLNE